MTKPKAQDPSAFRDLGENGTGWSLDRERILLGRIKALTWFFIVGLVISGATAIPLLSELGCLVKVTGAAELVQKAAPTAAPVWAVWLVKVQASLQQANADYPFLFYGTDWLAFGHFAIAIVFIGALIDPVRNRWLFTFGIIACLLVIPYALVFGAIRGIPLWWRLIDCCFGVFGIVPVWLCRKWAGELETAAAKVR